MHEQYAFDRLDQKNKKEKKKKKLGVGWGENKVLKIKTGWGVRRNLRWAVNLANVWIWL
jgi:hypothetical protein